MNDLPPLRLLHVFRTMVQVGGTKKAARALNVSQPAISQSLRQLEDHVGTALLDRRSRPATLTSAGQILVDAANVGIAALERALQDIRDLNNAASKALTVSCNLGYATYWLMPRLHDFYASDPGFQVNLQSVYRGQPGFDDGADIAIRFGDGNWPDSRSKMLFKERINPVCSAAYLETHGPYNELSDLFDADLVHVDPVEQYWFDWPSFFAEHEREVSGHLKGQRYSNYVHAVQATSMGAGIMLGWRGITDPVAGSLGLVDAINAPIIPNLAVYACIAEDKEQKKEAKAFLSWLASETTA